MQNAYSSLVSLQFMTLTLSFFWQAVSKISAGGVEYAGGNVTTVSVENLHLRDVVVCRTRFERKPSLPPERCVLRWKRMVGEGDPIVVWRLQNFLLRSSFVFSTCRTVSLIYSRSGLIFKACRAFVSASSSRPVFRQISAMLL